MYNYGHQNVYMYRGPEAYFSIELTPKVKMLICMCSCTSEISWPCVVSCGGNRMPSRIEAS